jgi:hypothetical protein
VVRPDEASREAKIVGPTGRLYRRHFNLGERPVAFDPLAQWIEAVQRRHDLWLLVSLA